MKTLNTRLLCAAIGSLLASAAAAETAPLTEPSILDRVVVTASRQQAHETAGSVHYLDEAVLEAERRLLFEPGRGYAGHELLVPNQGDYHVSGAEEGWALVHTPSGIRQVSNVCRHRQSVILEGRGNARNIVCPLHRWTYDMKGELLGAPHFPENPCLNLGKTPLQNWRGMLFAGRRDVVEEVVVQDGEPAGL